MGSTSEETYDLFVSYAHVDNGDGWITALVEVFKEIQLRFSPAQPWRVFFDTHAIRTMDDWEQRIGKGLRSAGVMLILISPAYFRSQWCRREWEQFCRQEERRGTPRDRIAVLYLETDPPCAAAAPGDDWRKDLQRRQHMDLRGWRSRGVWGFGWLQRLLGRAERHRAALRQNPDYHGQLQQLVWLINERLVALSAGSARRAGAPFHEGPFWPGERFVDRPEELRRLKRALLGAEGSPAVALSAVHGLGGVGKSTLAAACVRDPEVRAAFPDGVLWATLGQQAELATLLSGWIQALEPTDLQARTATQATATLRAMLQDRQTLLVVDDAWNLKDLEAFQVGGRRCRMLITTREGLLARSVGATVLDLGTLTPEQAETLLERCLGRSLEARERPAAQALTREVGYLPLALELAAAQVKEGESWQSLVNALRAEVARLEALDQPGVEELGSEAHAKNLSLTASLNLSLQRLSPERRDQFGWLGVAAEDAALTQGLAATLWQTDEPTARHTLQYLRDKALLLPGPRRSDGSPTYRLHDLFGDCARRLLTGQGLTLPEAHRALLDRYRSNITGRLWHTLTPDGYIHARLGLHLERAGDVPGLHALLREETADKRNGWYEANERLGQPGRFADDVARAWRLADAAFAEIPPMPTLGLQCHYALVTTSLNSLAGNLPPALLEALVRQSLWPSEQALAYARRTPELKQRVEALAALVPLLGLTERAAVLAEALQAARDIGDEGSRSRALTALAPQLPPEERAAVLAEALQAARGIGHEGYRSKILTALAPQLPPELLAEALQAARDIGCEGNRSRALAALAPQLPPELLAEALQAARGIGHEGYRSKILTALAPQLPPKKREAVLAEALQAARDIGYEGNRSRALAALAPQLPPKKRAAVLAEALQTARRIGDEGNRFKPLAALAPQLPPEERAAVLAEALHAARRIGNGGCQSDALAYLAPQLPPELLAEALHAARDITYGGKRDCALTPLAALAPQLPPEERAAVLAEALQVALGIGHEGDRTEALAALAPQLPPELLAEALQAARRIGDERIRSEILALLAPQLPPEERAAVLTEALQAARGLGHEGDRSEALSALAPQLPPELLAEALQAARDIEYEGDRSRALRAVAPQLPPQKRAAVLAEALQVALGIGHEGDRSEALAALAPQLPPELLAEALQAARDIGYERSRSRALAALAPQLPPELLAEALQAARGIGKEGYRPDQDLLNNWDRSEALAALAPQLPPELLAEALQAARGIGHEGNRSRALAALAPQLPPELLAEALQAARGLGHEGDRSEALSALAPQLPPELLAEALQAARDIEYEEDRSRALRAVAPQLPPQKRAAVLAEALQAARDIGHEGSRSHALTALAPQLPPELLAEALQAARGIGDQGNRSEALAALAPQLPPKKRAAVLAEALQAARDIGYERSRSHALTALAPQLPPELLAEALQAARDLGHEGYRSYEDIVDNWYRSEALAALAPQLPPELLAEALQAARDLGDEGDRSKALTALASPLAHLPHAELSSLWTETLHLLAVRTRPDLLNDLRSLAPVLKVLAGTNAPAELREIARAIRDVARWWP